MTFFSTSVVGLFFGPKGTIEFNRVTEIGETRYERIRIRNFDSKKINDLQFSIPYSLPLERIKTSKSLVISETGSKLTNGNYKLINIGLIPAESVTEIYIPTDVDKCCTATNLKDLGLTDITNERIESKNSIAFQNALIYSISTTIIFTLIYSIFLYLLQRKLAKLENEQKTIRDSLDRDQKAVRDSLDKAETEFDRHSANLKQDIDSLNRTTKELREENTKLKDSLDKNTTEFQTLLARQKALYLKRISDYRTELEFWRNVASRYFYTKSQSINEAEKFLSNVTKTLGTYTTNEKQTHELAELITHIEVIGSNNKT
jgi:hypothetical protein